MLSFGPPFAVTPYSPGYLIIALTNLINDRLQIDDEDMLTAARISLLCVSDR